MRDAMVELDKDLESIVIRRRDPAAVARFPAVTRTGPVTEILFEGRLPGMPTYLDGIKAAIGEVGRGGDVTCPGSIGAGAVAMCIGALVASRERQFINLPIDPASPWGQEHWPIS
jgi:hypothetical protein